MVINSHLFISLPRLLPLKQSPLNFMSCLKKKRKEKNGNENIKSAKTKYCVNGYEALSINERKRKGLY
jgi:hypothetical protein